MIALTRIIKHVEIGGTKRVYELNKFPYKERLLKLNLPTLAYRRKRGDLIETYKI